MPTAKATKASDKAQTCRKLVVALQKLYGKSLPRMDLPVLETFLFAICLEDDSWDTAETCYRNLTSSYFDLNEVRVSSIVELEMVLSPLVNADWKGLRIRSMLRYVFESSYSFEFEKFRRLTQEAAVKAIKKISDLTPFVRDFALQQILGSHIVCLDDSMLKACQWLGLVPPSMDATNAGEFLKGGLKKSEVAEFCHLLRCVATDDRFRERLSEPVGDDLDLGDAPNRLVELQSPAKKKTVKAVEKTNPAVSAPAEKSPGKKTKSSGRSDSGKSEPARKKKDKASGNKGATAGKASEASRTAARSGTKSSGTSRSGAAQAKSSTSKKQSGGKNSGGRGSKSSRKS